MRVWQVALLLGATIWGPILYGIAGGAGAMLFGGLGRWHRAGPGLSGAILAGLSALPVTLSMVGMEYVLGLCSISPRWTTLAVGVGCAWASVVSVRRDFLSGAGLVNGGFLWLAWKLWSWLAG